MTIYHEFIDNKIDEEELLTASELAGRLKINLNQLYKLVRAGLIPKLRIGRSLRFRWIAVIDSFQKE